MARDRNGEILRLGDYAYLKVKIVAVNENRNRFDVRVKSVDGTRDLPECEIHSEWLEKETFGAGQLTDLDEGEELNFK